MKTHGGIIMITKKILSVLMLALFVLSIAPLAIAGGSDADSVDDEIEIEEETEVEIEEEVEDEESEEEPRTRPRERDNEDRFERRARAVERVRERAENAAERVEVAHQRLIDAKEKFEDARSKFREHKKTLEEFRNKAACDSETEECKNHKRGLKNLIPKHLLKANDFDARFVDKLRDRVESSSLSDEDKAELLSKVDELEANLAEQRTGLEDLGEDASASDVRDAIKEARDTRRSLQKEGRLLIASFVHTKSEDMVDKHHGLVNSMEARIASLEKQGADVTELQSILERFKEHTASVDSQYEESKQDWKDAESKQDAFDDWKQANKQLRDEMKESKSILREFTQEFVAAKQSLGDTDDEAEESEDVDEESKEEDSAEQDEEEADESDAQEDDTQESDDSTDETDDSTSEE